MKRLFSIIALIICMSCENSMIDRENPEIGRINRVIADKGLISQLKTKSVETLNIGSNSLILEAYLWRDFMPVSPENGKPMIALNWLVDINSVKIPDNISLIKQYVIYNDQIWESDYENEKTTSDLPEYKIEGVSRNGPKWEPNIHVCVISEVHDSSTQKDHHLILENICINQTW